jgi:hypothetical protein
MDMNSSEAMPPDLTDAGMNMTNLTIAYNFLQDILDYTGFQPEDQTIDEAFWYGIVIVIGIAAIFNLIQWTTLKIRYLGSQLTPDVIESAAPPPIEPILPRPLIPSQRSSQRSRPWFAKFPILKPLPPTLILSESRRSEP